jgi:hypothetical protein
MTKTIDSGSSRMQPNPSLVSQARDINPECLPERSEGSVHSACTTNQWIVLLTPYIGTAIRRLCCQTSVLLLTPRQLHTPARTIRERGWPILCVFCEGWAFVALCPAMHAAKTTVGIFITGRWPLIDLCTRDFGPTINTTSTPYACSTIRERGGNYEVRRLDRKAVRRLGGVFFALLITVIVWLNQIGKHTAPATAMATDIRGLIALITHGPLFWVALTVILALAGWVYWRWARA